MKDLELLVFILLTGITYFSLFKFKS